MADQRGGGLHVHHLGAAGIADRAGATDDQDALRVDVQRGIIDAVVVILGTFEHDGAAFEGVRIIGVRQVAVAEFRRDDRGFHDRRVKEVALEVHETCGGFQRLGEGADHLGVVHLRPRIGFGDGQAADGHCLRVGQGPCRHEFGNHAGHAARAVEILAQKAPGRLQIDQKRDVQAKALPVVIGQLQPQMAGNGVQVNGRIGGPANGGIDHDGILEGCPRHDVGGLQILADHVHDASPGQIGHLPAFAVGGGNGGRAGQLHAQRLGQGIHGRGRAHGVAIAHRGGRGRGHFHEAFVVDLARRKLLTARPDDGAGSGALALVPAVQHRAHRQGNGGNIHRGRRHEQRGRGLVAADGQDNPVQRIAVERFDQPKIGQVAVQRRRGALAGFLDRVDGKFKTDAARGDDAVAHALGQFHMVAVAGRQVRSRLGDADDRLAGLQFLAGDAVVQIALDIERGHAGVVGVVEPGLRTEFHEIPESCAGACRVAAPRATLPCALGAVNVGRPCRVASGAGRHSGPRAAPPTL